MIKNKIILSLVLLLFIASCKPSKQKLIEGKWQETGIENPQMEDAMREQQNYIDTLGSHAPADPYTDSLKRTLQGTLDSLKKMNVLSMEHTIYDFKQRGVVYMQSDDGLDSAAYYFDEEGGLILDEMKLKGTGSRIRMDVDTLTAQTLRLRYTENDLQSVAIFSPVKK